MFFRRDANMWKKFMSLHISTRILVIVVFIEIIIGVNTPEPAKFFVIGTIILTFIVYGFYGDRRLRKQAGDD